MPINVCPCMPLQKGTMVLAVIDGVLGVLNLCLLILALSLAIRNTDSELTNEERNVAITICVILIVVCVFEIVLAFTLYRGAKNSNYRNCRTWFIVTSFVLVVNTINLIVNSTASDINVASFGGTLIRILYKVYEMLVVYQFLKKINTGLGAGVIYSNHSYPQPEPDSPSGQIHETP